MNDEGPHQDDEQPAAESTPTERVVLRLNDDELDENGARWEMIGVARHADKAAAIKQVVGDRPGKYRAPSLRSWKGGLEIVVPDKPKVEQKVFE